MLMGKIEAQQLQWYAVRVKRRQAGPIRKVITGGKFEAYRDRQGRVRKRRIDGTGELVFLPEVLLRKAGFEVFLPVKKVLRRKNRFSPEKIFVTQPLLVDWMFVGWPVGQSRWHQLMELGIVTGVMGTGGRPVRISPVRVQKLMRQWGGGYLSPECHNYMKTGCEFVVGDTAWVVSGPFDGEHVRIIELGSPTVKVMLDIFGRDVPAELRSDLLKAARPNNTK